jgi:hypothetical protein
MSTNGYFGLCSTCEGRATCTYPHLADRPTLFCAEFDWMWQHRMQTAVRAEPVAPRREVRSDNPGKKTSKYKGLCATCEKQETCTFPRGVGESVWHCEEFA